MEWSVASEYRIIEAPRDLNAHLVAPPEEPVAVIAAIEADRARIYDPRERPSLYREFAALATAPAEQLVDFARQYGLLTNPQALSLRFKEPWQEPFKRHVFAPPFDELRDPALLAAEAARFRQETHYRTEHVKGELVAMWRDESRLLRLLLTAWDYLTGEIDGLKASEHRSLWEYAFLSGTPDAVHKFVDVLQARKAGAPQRAAKALIADTLTQRASAWSATRIVASPSSVEFLLESVAPQSLRDLFWQQATWDVTRVRDARRCDFCQQWMSRGKDRQYRRDARVCGPSCRAQIAEKRKKETEKTKGAKRGKTKR